MPYNQDRFLVRIARGQVREALAETYRQIVRMFEDGYHPDDQDDDGGEANDVASHAQRVKQASDQQIGIGEKFLQDGEVVRYAADQTANQQEFVLDNADYARDVIFDGEASYAAAIVYETIYNDREEEATRPNGVVSQFMRKAGMTYEAERQRMRGVYGVNLPEEEDRTDIELDEIDLNRGFTRRGW